MYKVLLKWIPFPIPISACGRKEYHVSVCMLRGLVRSGALKSRIFGQ